jgi:L-fuculose-phosphate aldolase
VQGVVQLRREMIDIAARMETSGLIVAAEGNLSVRLGGFSFAGRFAGQGTFLVTPSGVAKGQLRASDLLEVGADGRCPQGKVTSEWPLHQAIYQARPDALAICHAHSPWSTAFAVAGRDLDGAVLTETAELLPRVPVARRARPGSHDAAQAVVELIGDHDAVLMGGHGVVALGKNLTEAFHLLQTVERLAQVTLLAEMAAGCGGLDEATRRNLLERILQNPPR